MVKIEDYGFVGTFPFIVLEYCNDKTLSDFITKNRQILIESEILEYFQQILCGFKDLHKKHIVHRDFKTDNILCHINENGKRILKICDFGFSYQLSDSAGFKKTQVGTAFYMVPLILLLLFRTFTCRVRPLSPLPSAPPQGQCQPKDSSPDAKFPPQPHLNANKQRRQRSWKIRSTMG